jgi:hypothetical protein
VFDDDPIEAATFGLEAAGDVGDSRATAVWLGERSSDVLDSPTDKDWFWVENDGAPHPASQFLVKGIGISCTVYQGDSVMFSARAISTDSTLCRTTFATTRYNRYYVKVESMSWTAPKLIHVYYTP